jgi:hypothetical protein
MGVIAYLYSKAGVTVFLFRATELLEMTLSPTLRLIYAHFLRPFSLSLFFIYYLLSKYKYIKKSYIIMNSLLIITVILNFPTAPARFYTFSIIFSLYITFFMKREKSGTKLLAYVPVALILASFIDIFRRIRSFSEFTWESFSLKLTGTLHFDAYETFLMTIKYVKEEGILFGSNLIGAFTFFVPRSLWESKPVASNFLLVRSGMPEKVFVLDKNFENISCPLIGEAYLAFGFFGVIFLSILVAFINAGLDNYLKVHISNEKNRNLSNDVVLIIMGALMGLFVFNLRGAFMSTFGYTFSFIMAYYFSLKFFKINLNLKIKKYNA